MSNNGKKDPLDNVRELLVMTATQTAENAKQINQNAKQIDLLTREIRGYAKEHDREMKEIRALFKDMIKRIAS